MHIYTINTNEVASRSNYWKYRAMNIFLEKNKRRRLLAPTDPAGFSPRARALINRSRRNNRRERERTRRRETEREREKSYTSARLFGAASRIDVSGNSSWISLLVPKILERRLESIVKRESAAAAVVRLKRR